jgi:carbonic anhydrase
MRQVFNVATSPIVAKAWENGQELNLYGLIYNLADGLVTRLAGPINCKLGKY